MSRRSYEFVRHAAAPPDRVFDVLADVPNWSRWAGPFIRQSWFERQGTPAPGGVGAVRGLGTRIGGRVVGSREEIVEYDRPRHLAYVILSGAPVRGYRADVTMEPDGAGTRIVWRGGYEPKAAWSAPLVHLVLTGAVRRLVKGLVSYSAQQR